MLQLDLVFHGAESLKDKRGRLRQLLAKVRHTFDVSAAEVGAQDLWQRAEIGVATVGNDRAVINQRLDHVINFVESLGLAEIVDHRIEMINI